MMYFLTFMMLVYGFLLYMLWRNYRVFTVRSEMSDVVFNTNDWQWRLQVYKSVTYDDMMLQFWKPVKPKYFYKDLSFLEDES